MTLLAANRNATALPNIPCGSRLPYSAALVDCRMHQPGPEPDGRAASPASGRSHFRECAEFPIDSEFSAQTFARDRVEVRDG